MAAHNYGMVLFGILLISVQSDQFVLQYSSHMMHQKQVNGSEILVKRCISLNTCDLEMYI